MGVMTDIDPPRPGPDGSAGRAGDVVGDDAAATGSLWERSAVCFGDWRAGDRRAMDELVRLMTPVLWQVVRAYGLQRMLAEDVVQSTWLALVRRHESIRDPRAVAGWLITSARRQAWRASSADRRVRARDAAELEPLLPPGASAEEHAHLADRDRRLWRALELLDERCRRLLRVVAFAERPDYVRLARDLDMPMGSIGPTRGRCLGKLRTALQAEGWDGDSRGL